MFIYVCTIIHVHIVYQLIILGSSFLVMKIFVSVYMCFTHKAVEASNIIIPTEELDSSVSSVSEFTADESACSGLEVTWDYRTTGHTMYM